VAATAIDSIGMFASPAGLAGVSRPDTQPHLAGQPPCLHHSNICSGRRLFTTAPSDIFMTACPGLRAVAVIVSGPLEREGISSIADPMIASAWEWLNDRDRAIRRGIGDQSPGRALLGIAALFGHWAPVWDGAVSTSPET
jgi:hypothetical protein